MGSVAVQLFSGLSRDVQSGSSPSSGWATQGYSETCPEATTACLGCVLMVIVLLEGKPSSQSEVLTALEQVLIKELPVLFSIHLSLNPD